MKLVWAVKVEIYCDDTFVKHFNYISLRKISSIKFYQDYRHNNYHRHYQALWINVISPHLYFEVIAFNSRAINCVDNFTYFQEVYCQKNFNFPDPLLKRTSGYRAL
jgi:hypothetical protein